MQELEVTWRRAIKVWWSITWRVVIYSALLGFIISFPLGVGSAALGLAPKMVGMVSQIIGSLCGLVIAVWAVLGKHYSDFRIILVPSDEAMLRNTASTADSG